jgi:hypothetical protein
MEKDWRMLRTIWINDDGLTAALRKFLADGKQWPLIGYTNAVEFLNHLQPDTRFLLTNGPDRYRLLMELLLKSGTVTESEIIDHGFSKSTASEVIRALARDHYIQSVDDGYIITGMGKISLPGLLVA